MNRDLTAAGALILALCSCSGGGWAGLPSDRVHELSIAVPEVPSSWSCLSGIRMTVSWLDADGRSRSAEAEPGSTLPIEIARGFPQAILAQPSASGLPLRPAGALYPDAFAGGNLGGMGELRLDWRGGYAASVARALERGGVDPSGFDLDALAGKAIERAGDPWLVEPLEVARRLAEGSFRIDLFRNAKRFPVSLPAPGPWAPESPFAGSVLSGGAAELPPGLRRFVGPGGELIASVGDAGEAFFAIK